MGQSKLSHYPLALSVRLIATKATMAICYYGGIPVGKVLITQTRLKLAVIKCALLRI